MKLSMHDDYLYLFFTDLGTSWVNPNGIIEVTFRRAKLHADRPALSHFSSVGTNHVETDHFQLTDRQTQTQQLR